VGVAFDYALRFGFQARRWATQEDTVAENGVLQLIALGHPLAQVARRRLKSAQNILNTLSPTAELSVEAAVACFHLWGLDLVVRPGRVDWVEYNPSSEEVVEVQELYKIVPWHQFKPEQHLLLNPTFNKGSQLVGGADADLICDHMLIDIKTVKEQKVDMKMVRQVVGYALLANNYGVSGVPGLIKLTHGAIYFARAGQFVSFPLHVACPITQQGTVLQHLIEQGR
jgi:hypothetical protein